MKTEDTIVNRVEKSGLLTIDLQDYLMDIETRIIDLKDYLFQGLVLKEKDLRGALKALDGAQFKDAAVLITCTADAIIPAWAYMLLMSKLSLVTQSIAIGNEADLERVVIDQAIDKIKWSDYADAKVVIKGCGSVQQRDYAYAKLTQALLPHVASMMYGEPCSTVPVYKKPKKTLNKNYDYS